MNAVRQDIDRTMWSVSEEIAAHSQGGVVGPILAGRRRRDFDEVRPFETEINQPAGAEFGVVPVVGYIHPLFNRQTSSDYKRVAIARMQLQRLFKTGVRNPTFDHEHARANRLCGSEERGRQADGRERECDGKQAEQQPALPGRHPNFLALKEHRAAYCASRCPAGASTISLRSISAP